MQLDVNLIKSFLDMTLLEDHGIGGDISSTMTIDHEAEINFTINSRENIILSGVPIAEYFLQNYSTIKYKLHFQDGDKVTANHNILTGKGKALEVLKLERVILNYLQHLSGIATLTSKYVEQTTGTTAKIYDTRKTIPGLRMLQKYAVRCGGGHNHRLALDSAIMLKDNHIAIVGDITKAIKRAKNNSPHYARVEVECDTLAQVTTAIAAGADIIMLDNMSVPQINEAVSIINKQAIIEASGGVNLDKVKAIAKCGVDIISVGKLTHSAAASDIGLDIVR